MTTLAETRGAEGSLHRQSLSQLQRTLRSFFREDSPARALLRSLAHLGEYLGGDYVVVHARLGLNFLSEEFSDGFEPSDQLRDFINDAMSDAMASGRAGCVRLSAEDGQEHGPAVIAALLHDEEDEQAGAAAILLRSCDRDRAIETLATFESSLGFLSVLLSRPNATDSSAVKGTTEASVLADVPADNAAGLSFHVAAQLCNCHDVDQVAVGLVRGSHVEVMAIRGMDEIRSTNPGVKLIRAAMEECMDAGEPILHYGPLDDQQNAGEDHPLHRHWSQGAGGDTVGTFPLYAGERMVAVVAVRQPPGSGIQPAHLTQFGTELEAYGRLFPLADRAGRSLYRHTVDILSAQMRLILGSTRRRVMFTLAAGLWLMLWLIWGTLPYSISVPAEIAATNSRTVAAPRDGTLIRVHVQPGDTVVRGQVLAEIDARADRLRRAELTAKLAALEVDSDRALSTGTPVERRVLDAQRRTLQAELASVEFRIDRSLLRASIPGVILTGDLRTLVGASIHEGQSLFHIADLDRVHVVLKIPERSVVVARDYVSAGFAPAATPYDDIFIDNLHISPAATADDSGTVFHARAVLDNADGDMAPGMEGVAYLDMGPKNAFWVLTHRITDWLRLTFWM